MNCMYPKLSEPGRIGNLVIKNRVVKAPQSTGMSNIDGSVSERLVRHYRELARGGTGLIVVEYAFVDNIASKSAHCQLGISNVEHIPGLAWLADVIKDNGARAAIQIEHCGRQKFLGAPPIKSASAIAWPALMQRVGRNAIPEPLTIDEILEIEEAFGQAALRAVMAGFELIEIHGAHGYLITNFLSPHTNKRDDMYGGSLENRMRFLLEIVNNIRGKIGPNFPLTVRLSGSDYEPDGFGIEETIQVCKVLETRGIDAIHVSGGDHHQMIHQVSPMAVNRGHNVWAAEAIKKAISIPVIASGSITMPDYAEEIIATGKGDFVGLGRPLWADQYWTKKAIAGHPEDIRPCIRCNEGCLERTFFRFRAVTCGVNPTIGREGDLQITPAEKPKRVVVIGGGPGGMEAARVCAMRGHKVTLYEKRKLGGVLNEASVPEFKSDIRFFQQYLMTQMKKLKVGIIEKQAKVDMFDGTNYDVAIVAIGAKPSKLTIPGIDRAMVYEAVDILNNSRNEGENVVVIGGGLVGSEVAMFLSEQGKNVTVVEMLDEIMRDCAVTDKIAYSERIADDRIKIITSYKLDEIREHSVIIVDKAGRRCELEADMVVMAVGYSAQHELYSQLKKETEMEVYAIGDCVVPGKIYDAIHTAYKMAIQI
ncbi:MAG: FAD-dependent oxidoreductase [candidate division Zixibacteria bacterium]|nr:FAD-dependent oxidoreductase [candidate division Zixibacteria bacterium]